MLTVILTGGASRRMGRDKAMLPCAGRTMLQYLIDKYSVLGPVAVSVNAAGRFPFTGARELPDRWPNAGPLNGIAAAFLGDYSDEKYEEFIKATGVSDLSDMDNSEISALCRQFVYYLRELRDNGNEVLEKDGRPMLDGININA